MHQINFYYHLQSPFPPIPTRPASRAAPGVLFILCISNTSPLRVRACLRACVCVFCQPQYARGTCRCADGGGGSTRPACEKCETVLCVRRTDSSRSRQMQTNDIVFEVTSVATAAAAAYRRPAKRDGAERILIDTCVACLRVCVLNWNRCASVSAVDDASACKTAD